ncbi:hypothetical protein ACYOEI_18960, partial [Singulisphaera rosea]
ASPPPPPTSAPAVQPASAPNRPAAAPVKRAQSKTRRQSIVHHYPYPYPAYYHGDRSAGWRNPGGVGRFAEYYPAGNQMQIDNSNEHDAVRVATFGDGGVPTRQEQMQAQQIGIQRENSIMRHIDNYARPSYGYGMGVGYFGGFY